MKELLLQLNACQEAREWAGDKSWEDIFNTCHRGDWLLWLYKRTNQGDLKKFILAKAYCANTVRHLMKDQRSINAVDTTIKFGNGEATIEELNLARKDAYAAAAAADDAAAAAAAYAAYAAADDDDAGADAYAYAARIQNQQLTADICRKYLPIEIWNLKLSI